MERRLHVGRVENIDVTLDWSWIVAFVLAAATIVSLDRHLLPGLHPVKLAVAAIATTVGLFASLGAHELARVSALRASGAPVERLTLFVVGGSTNVERLASPRAEVRAALAAPAFSLAVGLIVLAGTTLANAPFPRAWNDLDRLGAPGVVLLQIALANILIAVVNLLPAYPLDGGRLLRAALWRITGDIDHATRMAAWCGQTIGFTLILIGVGVTFAATSVPGTLIGPIGIWTSFFGWFLASAAAQAYATRRKISVVRPDPAAEA